MTATTVPQIVPGTLTGDLDITSFTVEHYPGDALGIAVRAPRMNWTYSHTVPEDAQILLTLTRRVPGSKPREEKTYLPADDGVLVPWQFEPLVSREEVFATVQAVSASHKPLGAVSRTLHFEAGLFEEFDHVADFVGPSWAEPESDHRHLPLVRTEIELKDQPVRARLYLTALGLVEAEINGAKVGNDALIPGWTNYEQRVEMWTYDVTENLSAGTNAMGFWLGDGWYRGRLGFDGGYANYYGDRIGVFAQLEVEYADGSTDAVTAAWSIGKATQEAPNGLIGVAPTTEGGSDGKITGVDATMEYRAESETIYTTCTGIEIENLPAGNYFVRYAEDHNHFASPDAEVTVGEGTPLADCTITFNASGGSGSMDSVTVNAWTIYILPACGFTAPADQEFKAWEIGGTEYKVGDSYTVLVDTEIKALWENSVITPTTYTVTVSNDGNGTASASHAKAAAGTEITLTATPQIGYHFKGWQVESPAGLVITNNKFTMPDGNVDVKAIFEKDAPPAPTEFIVTFDGNGGTPSVGSMTTTDRKLTSLPSASRSGSYSFYGWYTEKSGGIKITTDTVFHANATVYAHWTYTGGGGGDYNPPVTYYTLRFETGGGSDIPSVQGTYNTYIDLTKYVPTWRGHAFIGWYSERSLTNKVSGVCLTKDMTVYAGWRMDENPGTGVNPFTDISEKDWFYGDVMFVYENGLMLGTSKTLFSPHGTAMRGMMATILWRMEGSPVPKGKNSFTDVEAGKWYADAITWTTENGIFAGYGKDKFCPDDPITREQLAAIFYRYADYKGYDLTVKGDLDKFKDADKITDYAKTAMQWAVGSGLVKGKSGNLLDPQGTATRAEIAAMLHRFIEKYELVQGKAPGGLMGWIDPKRLQIPKTGDSSV